MARIPEVIRRNPLSQVAATPAPSGQGWAALANLAQIGANFVKPAAMKQAAEEGLRAVYRDQDGTLKVEEKSVLGGEFADTHNTAAYAKYLAQKKIDMSQTFTELAQKYEFDPAGFKSASDAYIRIMEEDESVPAALKEDILLDARAEGQNRFNGLYKMETDRNYRDADRNTKTHRDMLVDDYVNLFMAGDTKAAEAKYREIVEVSRFRESAPYISETPAESDAYLRGVRSSAKVARLTQRLSETSGATSLSDEMKSEIDGVLNDPDIDPDTRRRLYVATQGRLKGIDANAAVDGLTSDTYEAKVRRAESGGNVFAKNPNSSATGPHQFTSGTWLDTVADLRARGGAKWADGMSTTEILAARTDAGASSEVFAEFRAQNAATLAKNGLPVTDATEYLAHFLGAGGAVMALKADPAAALSTILPANVIDANPFLKNMNVSDLRNWAARKMTVKASDIALQQRQIDLIDDTEVRAMATSALNDRYGVRKRMEDAAAIPYGERMAAKDDTLTEQEIMEDQNLSDAMQGRLVEELRSQRADQIKIGKTVAALNDETVKLDPYDRDSLKDVNTAYESVLGDDDPLSAQGQTLAGEIALRTGFLPQRSFNAMRAAVNGTDPKALASSMEFANQIIDRVPNAIGMYDGRADVLDALADYQFKSGFMGAEAAATQMIEERSPDAVAKRRNLSDAAKTAAKNLKPGDITDFFGQRGASVDLSNAQVEASVMDEYGRLFQSAYLATGDFDMAKNRALTSLSTVYGGDQVTGSNRMMKFPPQKFYPMPVQDMRSQLEADVSAYVFGDGATQGLPLVGSDRWISSDRITILSDERTRHEVSAGKPPSYQIMYLDLDGTLEMVPKRYTFDPTASLNADQAERDAEMQALKDGQSADGAVRNLRAWRTYLEGQGYGVEGALQKVMENKAEYSAAPPPKE